MNNTQKDYNSILKLDQLFFEHIRFERKGNSMQSEVKIRFDVKYRRHEKEEKYRVDLRVLAEKEKDYTLDICVVGIFSFDTSGELEEKTKEMLISKNTVAILMPYIRSEVSIVTAQPGMTPIVLPPFNVNALLSEGETEKA